MTGDQPLTWRVIRREPHVLELEGFDGSATIESDGTECPIATQHVSVTHDGCVNYSDYANGYGWDHTCSENCSCIVETLHICDLDSFITSLQALRQLVKEHRGTDR